MGSGRNIGRLALTLIAVVATSCSDAIAQVSGLDGTLVIVNKRADSVSIVDVGTGRELAVLPTGAGPHEVAVSPDGRTAVITDYGGRQAGNTLTVVDLPDLRVTRTIDLGKYERPHGVAWLPGGEQVLVTSESTRSVIVVEIESGRVRSALPTDQAGSHMLALPARAGRVWTSNIADGTVSEIDLESGSTARVIEVAEQPEAIGITPDGVEVWVGSNEEGTVSVVDAVEGGVSPVLDGFRWPYRVHITPDGDRVLIPDLRAEELRIVARATRAELHRIDLTGGAPQGVTTTPDGRTAFQSLSESGVVLVIDVETGMVRDSLPARQGPDGVAYSPISVGPGGP